MNEFQRATAYKIWIGDLINGSYTKGSGQFDMGYVEIFNKKISKVNLIGGVVDRFEGENYISLDVDDGSGIIRIKSWGEDRVALGDIAVGDLVLLIGKVKEYNNQIFVTPEIIRKLDNPLWLKARKLELTKLYGETKRSENRQSDEPESGANRADEPVNNIIMENVVEEKIEDSKTDAVSTIISLIEKLDFGDGADIEEVVKKSSITEANEIIQNLLMDGEVFEVRKGKLRVME